MDKVFLLSVLLVAFSFTAAADVYHEAEVSEDGMILNSSLQLECESDCPVNKWSLTWQLPDSAEVIGVEDSMGGLDDYTISNGRIRLITNSGPKRMNETVLIQLNVTEDSEEIYRGLHQRRISLPGFGGEESTGVIHAENLISGWRSYGFKTSYTENSMKFQGEGPVNLRLKFGDGNETDYYTFFGDHMGNTSQAYEIAIGTTGLEQDFERFPVASMPSDVYNRTANRWSAGEYLGGSMMIRQELGGDYIPVLAHETVHGLNDRELNWDRTSSAYFDEGTSEYVEFLVRKKLSAVDREVRPPGEVFGEDVRWDPDPGDGRYSLIPSSGDREELWQYYQNDREFMKSWSSSDAAYRSFGYAYSQLLVQNYVVNGGRLSEIYKELEVDRKVEDPEEKWSVYSEHLDMRPCEYSSRVRFKSCLDGINEYDYSVYSAKPFRNSSNLTVSKLEIPENRFKQDSNTVDTVKYRLSGLFNYLERMVRDLISGL